MPANPYVREAVKLMLDFHSVIEQVFREGGLESVDADSLATRLSNFPAIAMDSGVVPAITFYLSKIDSKDKRDLFENLVALLTASKCGDNKVKTGNESLDRRLKNDLKNDLKEEAYVSASALLLSLMTRLGMIGCPGDGGVKGIARELLRLLDAGVRGEEGFMEAAIELKKLGTAFYKRKKRYE